MSSVNQSPIGPATAGKRGTQSAAHFTKLEDLPANAALEARLLAIESAGGGAVDAVTEANGLTLTTGTLAMAAAANGVAGALTAGAQELDGPKTFLASLTAAVEAVTALVRAVGVSLVLRSSLGAGASDKCVVVGSSQEDGTVNTAARLQEWQTGIGGGTPVTKAYLTKAGAFTAELAANTGNADIYSAGIGAVRYARCLVAPQTTGAVWYLRNTGGIGDESTHRIGFSAGIGASEPGGYVFLMGRSGVDASSVGVVSRTDRAQPDNSRLHSFRNNNTEKSAIMGNGEFEHAVAGAGIVLKSPDGTRYRIAVSDAGALVPTPL